MLKSEQETHITFNSEDAKAYILSMHPKIWRQCEKAGAELVESGTREGKEAWRKYLVDKSFVKIRGKRVVGDEERLKRSERLRELRGNGGL